MKNQKAKPTENRPSPGKKIQKPQDPPIPDLTRWANKQALTLRQAARLSAGIDPDKMESPERAFKKNPDTGVMEIANEAEAEAIAMMISLEPLFRREMRMRPEEVPFHVPEPSNFPDRPPIPEDFHVSTEKIKAHFEMMGLEPLFFFHKQENIPPSDLDRIIGRKDIAAFFSKRFSISSFMGARAFCLRNGIPIHRIRGSRKPYVLISEVEAFDCH